MFQQLLDRTLYSSNVDERHSIPLGVYYYGGDPVLLPARLWTSHGVVSGPSQSAKTLLLRQIVTAAIRAQHPARRQWLLEQKDAAQPCSVCIIDLKGDNAQFNEARAEAARAGMPFRFFCCVPTLGSNLWVPLEQRALDRVSINTRAEFITRMLDLYFGRGYGMQYFQGGSKRILDRVFTKRPELRTFAEIDRLLDDPAEYQRIGGNDVEWNKSDQLRNAIHAAASIHSLNLRREDFHAHPDVRANAIDLEDLLVGPPKVFYFYLPTTEGPDNARASGIFATLLLKVSAANVTLKKDNRVLLVLDEFHQILSHDLADTLTQMLSKGVSLVMSHHFREQLVMRNLDLRGGVDANVGYEIITGVSTEETLQRMKEIGPLGRFHSLSFFADGSAINDPDEDDIDFFAATDANPLVNVHETKDVLYNRNTLHDLGGHGVCMIWMKRVTGTVTTPYPSPFIVSPHVEDADFRVWADTPPPSAGEGLFVVQKETPTPVLPDPIAHMRPSKKK